MTRLLVSVRSLDEAIDAVEAGADLIDLKEPAAGSLGRVPTAVAHEVAKRLGRQAPVSMALGELAELGEATELASSAGAGEFYDIPLGVSFVKLGLAGCATNSGWAGRWAAVVDRLPATCAPVAVIYADWQTARAPSPDTVLATARSIGCRALLIDTFAKSGGALFDYLQPSQLSVLLTAARMQGLVTVLAGSLTATTAPLLLPLRPDYLAVRGAVCDGSRVARLVPAKVRQWQALVRQPLAAC